MAQLLLDAHAVACPQRSWFASESEHIDALHKYFHNLVAWQGLRDFPPVRFFSDADLIPVLSESGCYPLWDSVRAALTESGLAAEFQLQDIHIILQSLLNKSASIEEFSNIEEVEVDHFSLYNDCLDRMPSLAPQVGRLLAIKAVLEVDSPERTDEMRLITISSDAEGPPLSFGGRVTALRSSDEIFGPTDVATTVECYARDDLRLRYDEFLWWRQGKKEPCKAAVVLTAARAFHDPAQAASELWEEISLGKNFLDSARNLGFIHDKSRAERLIRACRETLLRKNMAATHHLRTSEAADAPPHKRNKHVSWRRDIDHEFHLHYWDDGSSIELADVVVHGSFAITR